MKYVMIAVIAPGVGSTTSDERLLTSPVGAPRDPFREGVPRRLVTMTFRHHQLQPIVHRGTRIDAVPFGNARRVRANPPRFAADRRSFLASIRSAGGALPAAARYLAFCVAHQALATTFLRSCRFGQNRVGTRSDLTRFARDTPSHPRNGDARQASRTPLAVPCLPSIDR